LINAGAEIVLLCKKKKSYDSSRRRALASFKSGDKQGAYRYVRQSKVFSQSRNRCTQLLERVEEVISLIASAESTKKVQYFITMYILYNEQLNYLFVILYIYYKQWTLCGVNN
jgi:charged multivesicular body protein 7